MLLVQMPKSYAAPHGSATKALTLLSELNAADTVRDETIAHRFVYPTGDLAPDIPSAAPRVYTKNAATGSVQVNEPVQTFDILNPPSAFTPTEASGKLDSVNTTPSWTKDEAFIVFSSTMQSSVATDPAGKAHIWAAPASGGAPIQLTSGTGDDLYPVLSPSNNFIAFVSNSGSKTGTHDLYVISFNEASPGAPVNVDSLRKQSLTVDLNGNSLFNDVGRPAWSPSEDRIAFAASVSSGQPYHIYYLYVGTKGYLPPGGGAGANPPGQFTAGPENDTDPSWSADGRYIAFSSNASAAGFTNTGFNVNPILGQTPCQASGTTTDGSRSIFLITGAGTVPNTTGADLTSTGGRITVTGGLDGGPAWAVSRSPYDGFIAFHRLQPQTTVPDSGGTPTNTGAQHYEIYYAQIETNVATGTLTTEMLGRSTKVNTSDVVDNGTNTTTNSFDDMYPTWSPQLKQLSLAYQSNRSVTYNDPATGAPSETLINITKANDASVVTNANYAGVLVSEVENINPPTLLRYTGSEIVHVNAGSTYTPPTPMDPSGGAVRYVAPGTLVTFTVRLSNRESGVDPSNVYIQIKDPDSKYDDSQGFEHKLFATDNPPIASANQNDTDYFDPLFGFGGAYTNSKLYSFIVDLGVTNIGNNANAQNRGAVGGAADATHDYGVGLFTGAGTLPIGGQADTTPNSSFRSWGPEYECQALDPLYFAKSRTVTNFTDPTNINQNHLNTLITDYYRPYYLAGFDDAAAHSAPMTGHAATQSPQWPGDARSGKIKPVTWLPMTLLPASQQDANGGKLYSVTWLTPTSQSDFYLDVIAYDNATNPVTSAAAKNWRIYDNIWGFTTQPWVGNNDILAVSDNTLGQKFAASTLGVANLRPTMYGDESYYTGIDANLLPNAVYIWKQPSGSQGYVPYLYPVDGPLVTTNVVLNALGKGSYTDGVIDPNFTGGLSDAPTQRYNIWRTLSRGPVDQTVLMSYAPTFAQQPAVTDNGITDKAATFPIAKKCVIWASPFTGDLLVGPGTFGSPSTQAQIAQFLKAGGRLFVSGQDIGSTITINGTINNTDPTKDFLPQYLGSTWKSLTSYNPVVTPGNATANRISHDALFNAEFPTRLNYWTETTTGLWVYGPPSSYSNIVSNALNWDALTLNANERSDGSMVDFTTSPGIIKGLGGNAVNGTMDELGLATVPGETIHNDYTIGNDKANGLVYYENTTNFGRVAYASFDLGGFGQEYYKVTIGQIDHYATHDFRSDVMHNIVTYLRTGTIAGTIRQNSGSGGGQVVANATVYAISTTGSVPGMPAGRTVYSATSDASGNYRIDGVESGNYNVVAYKPGYARATSLYAIEVEGDASTTLSLNMTAVPPGSIVGFVYGPDGKTGVSGAAVTFTAAGVPNLTGTTLTDGSFEIDNVPAGTYSGTATKGAATATASATVVSGQKTNPPVIFTLPATPAQISGTVSDSNGPISGATVSAASQTGGTPITATTNSSGQYTLSGVAPGSYSVTASASGHFPSTQKVSVSTGDAITLNFTLTIGTPTVLWGLVDGTAAKTPIGGISVSVKDNTGTVVASFVSTSTTKPAADSSGGTENYEIGLPAGSYTLVPNVTGVNPIPVTLTGPFVKQNIDISTGVIGGVIKAGPNGGPVIGATVTVQDSNGNTIATTTTTALTTPPSVTGSPSQANYFVDVQPGTYTVTVSMQGFISPDPMTKVVVTANQWTAVNLSFKVLQSFSAGLHFISVPYDYTSIGWDTLFGPKSGATANRSPAFIWQQQLQNGIGAYVGDPTPPADTPHYGLGYWIKLTSGVDITSQGAAIGTSTVSVPLSAGWNMIGVPNSNGISVSAITFANTADPTHPLTFDQATSPLYHMVGSTFYGYNETAHDYSDMVTSGGQLAPWKGYWLYAYQACTIQLPTGQ